MAAPVWLMPLAGSPRPVRAPICSALLLACVIVCAIGGADPAEEQGCPGPPRPRTTVGNGEYTDTTLGFVGEPAGPRHFRDGPAMEADFSYPTSVAVSPRGDVYVTEPLNGLVRVISKGRVRSFRSLARAVGGHSRKAVALKRPVGVVEQGGSLYLLEDVPVPYSHSRVWRIDPDTLRGNECRVPRPADATEDGISAIKRLGMTRDYVFAITAGRDTLLILRGETVLRRDRRGSLTAFAHFGEATQVAVAQPTSYFACKGIADVGGDRVALAQGRLVQLLNTHGEVTLRVGSPKEAGFLDGRNDKARFAGVVGVAWDPYRQGLVVADYGNHAIRLLTLDGSVTTLAGDGTPGHQDGQGRAARFRFPLGVCPTRTGDIYVADSGNNLIRKIAPDLRVTTVAGTGQRTGFRIFWPD